MSIRPFSVLPFRPPTPYIRPIPEPRKERSKAVTIALAFRGVDSHVFAADTLFTTAASPIGGAFGSYGRKIFALSSLHYSGVLTGCGSAEQLRAAKEILQRNLQNQEMEIAPSSEDVMKEPINVREALETTLVSLGEKTMALPEVQLIVALNQKGFGCLDYLRTEGMLVRDAGDVEIVGIGETSLVRYLSDFLYQRGHSYSKKLVPLATLIVQAAKKYCPQYCGGETNVCVLPSYFGDEGGQDARWVSAERITAIEKALDSSIKKQLGETISEVWELLGSDSTDYSAWPNEL